MQDDPMTTRYCCATAATVGAVLTYWRYRRKDKREEEAPPRPSFVASLVSTLNGGDETAWLNLGFWRDGPSSYPEAAEALAAAVAEAAGLSPSNDGGDGGGGGDRAAPAYVVVDVGCGLGESLRLWASRYGADPRRSVGVNVSAAEVAAARGRAGPLADRVVQGDACALPVADGAADVVLAVDAAYHFRTRRDFLREAARALRPGGAFAAADIVGRGSTFAAKTTATKTMAMPLRHSWARRLVCAVVGIPLCNVYDAAAYAELLTATGLADDISIRDVTADVTDGFAAWTAALGRGDDHPERKGRRGAPAAGASLAMHHRAVLWAVGGFLAAAMRIADLRFVLVSATKTPGGS